jgi:alpha-glucuronidase
MLLVSIGVKAVGHALIDINDPVSCGIQTWLQYPPPFPLSAQEVVARRYLAIHPVKNTPEGRALRAELRRLLTPEQSC